jgi:glucosylceramidase
MIIDLPGGFVNKCKLVIFSVAMAVMSPLSLSAQASKTGGVDVWLTTADKAFLFAEQPRIAFAKASPTTPVIEVNSGSRMQPIDGFGFALTGGSAELLMRMSAPRRAALLKELFTPNDDGIGVSYLRVTIGSSDMNERVFTYDDMPAGETDPQLTHFDLGPDHADVIPVLREILAVNPHLKILGSPWSAPSWMKSNDAPKAGNLKPEFYKTYAQYFVDYLKGMAAEGIIIHAITVQNEPLNPKNLPSMVMSSQEEDTFIRTALGPALKDAGLKTEIILYDHNCDRPDYPLDILADPLVRTFVTGSGFHLYGGEVSALSKVHDAYPDKGLYFTEQMVIEDQDETPFKIAQPVSRIVIGATRNWSRNALLWNLAADPHNGPHTNDGGCPICQGAITLDGDKVTRNLAFYTIAHAAKFVRPGSVRIASDLATPELLPNVAFATPNKKTVLLVANPDKIDHTFAVHAGKRVFTATLKAGAVATYVWR